MAQVKDNTIKVLDNQKLVWVKQRLGVSSETKDLKKCWEGTRSEILSEMNKWASDVTSHSTPFLWITGPPGIGKSTLIETWVQKVSQKQGHTVGAYYSFSGEQNKGVIDALASIMIKLVEKFQLVDALDKIDQILRYMPSDQYIPDFEQMNEMIKVALAGAANRQPDKPIFLGIDALDECKEDSIENLAKALTKIVMDGQSLIKLIVCSRYGTAQQAFDNLCEKKILEHKDLAKCSTEDIKIYIKAKTEEIRSRHSQLDLGADWLSEDKAAEMAESAEGLFIWVETAFGKSTAIGSES